MITEIIENQSEFSDFHCRETTVPEYAQAQEKCSRINAEPAKWLK